MSITGDILFAAALVCITAIGCTFYIVQTIHSCARSIAESNKPTE